MNLDNLEKSNLKKYEVKVINHIDNSSALVEFGVIKNAKVTYIQTNNQKASDSIIFTYNNENLLVQKLLFRTVKDEEIGFFAELETDLNGKTIEKVTTNFKYNSDHKLIAITEDGSSLKVETLIYNQIGQIVKRCINSFDNFCDNYRYDNTGLHISTLRTSQDNDSTKGWKKYNKSKLISEELQLDDEYLLPPSRFYYNYDVKGNLIELKKIDSDNDMWLTTYNYNTNNELTSKKEFYKSEFISSEMYEYDENGYLRKKIILDTDTGKPIFSVEYTYLMD